MSQSKMFQIIGLIESNHHQYAIRFEHEYFNRRLAKGWKEEIIARIRKANECSRRTAQMIYSSSWGSVQIMGFNLYHGENCLTRSVGEFMNDLELQEKEFNRFLRNAKLDKYTPEELANDAEARRRFAKTYNGAESYADLINNSLKHYGVK